MATPVASPGCVLYLRGLAYLKNKQGAEAAQEFERILALHNSAPSDPLMSFAHLGRGRAYALQGDTQKSRTAYQDFLRSGKMPTLISPP